MNAYIPHEWCRRCSRVKQIRSTSNVHLSGEIQILIELSETKYLLEIFLKKPLTNLVLLYVKR